MFSPKVSTYTVLMAVLLLCTIAGMAGSRSMQQSGSGSQLPTISAQELVQHTVDNELKAGNDNSVHYMFKDRRQTADGSRTKMMVETTQGTVAYLVAINDKPLTAEQRKQEDQRLQNLLSNPSEQSRKKKAQDTDNDRVARMFRELPKAFVFSYDGLVPRENGRTWVRLKFEPNPNYVPPSRETSVFKAMSGTMIVAPQVERMVKIEATLYKDVTFGWGILGRLNKGGHFIVEQTEIGDNCWEPTFMNIQFSGKALLFKTIDLRQIESTSDYTSVPNNLTLAQGVDILKKRIGSVLAENGSSR